MSAASGILQATPAVSVEGQELAALRATALDAVRASGGIALRHFRTAVTVDNKGGARWFDPVTEADRGVEHFIRDRLRSRWPEIGFFGEETGYEAGERGLTWVLDPIDGTRAFMSGFLHWGTLLALFNGQRPILGIMYQPYTSELFVGDAQGAHITRLIEIDEVRQEHSETLRTRGTAELVDAVLCTTGTQFFNDAERACYDLLAGAVRMDRFGGDCYQYAMLAAGQVDLVLEAGLAPYDIQALIPIVEAAGGVVTDWQGGDASFGGRVLASANSVLHGRALDLLATRSVLSRPEPT